MLPGGDLRVLFVAVLIVAVLVIGSVVTYLVVPLPTGSGERGRRSAWSAALGFFAAVPICYLVLVVAVQILAALHLRARDCASTHHFADMPASGLWSIRTIPQYSLVDIIGLVGYPAEPSTHPSPHRGSDLAIDEQHVALPKLYGAPAYARPPRLVPGDVEKPFDPDDLPIEVEMTPRSASSRRRCRPTPTRPADTRPSSARQPTPPTPRRSSPSR